MVTEQENTANYPVGTSPTVRWAGLAVNLSWWLGWVAAGLLAVMIVAMAVFGFAVRYSNLPLVVTMDEDRTGEVLKPIHSVGSLPIAGFKGLRVQAKDLPGLEYMMLAPGVLLAGFLWVVWLLRRFLANVKRGEPFSSENPGLIQRIGWLVTVAGPVYGLFGYIFGKVYLSAVDIPGATIEVEKDFHGLAIVAGLVILVLAQVYRSAVQIKTEADLTI